MLQDCVNCQTQLTLTHSCIPSAYSSCCSSRTCIVEPGTCTSSFPPAREPNSCTGGQVQGAWLTCCEISNGCCWENTTGEQGSQAGQRFLHLQVKYGADTTKASSHLATAMHVWSAPSATQLLASRPGACLGHAGLVRQQSWCPGSLETGAARGSCAPGEHAHRLSPGSCPPTEPL